MNIFSRHGDEPADAAQAAGPGTPTFLGTLRSELDGAAALPEPFADLEARFLSARNAYLRGDQDAAEFGRLLVELVLVDGHGARWTLGATTSQWYRSWNGGPWTPTPPPAPDADDGPATLDVGELARLEAAARQSAVAVATLPATGPSRPGLPEAAPPAPPLAAVSATAGPHAAAPAAGPAVDAAWLPDMGAVAAAPAADGSNAERGAVPWDGSADRFGAVDAPAAPSDTEATAGFGIRRGWALDGLGTAPAVLPAGGYGEADGEVVAGPDTIPVADVADVPTVPGVPAVADGPAVEVGEAGDDEFVLPPELFDSSAPRTAGRRDVPPLP